MGINSRMDEFLPRMFGRLGKDATFTPQGGSSVPCHIDISFNVDQQPDGFQTNAWQQSTVIEAILSEITNEPNRGDIFTCARKDYKVEKVISNDTLTVKVAVTP